MWDESLCMKIPQPGSLEQNHCNFVCPPPPPVHSPVFHIKLHFLSDMQQPHLGIYRPWCLFEYDVFKMKPRERGDTMDAVKCMNS